MVEVYQAWGRRRPLLARVVTDAVVAGAADVTTQKLLEDRSRVSWDRVTRFAGVHAVLAVYVHVKYRVLERLFRRGFLGFPSWLVQLIVDQAVFAPLHVALFFALLTLARGHTTAQAQRVLEKRWKKTTMASYKVWPAFKTLQYTVISPSKSDLTAQAVAFAWSIYLSFIGERAM